MENIEKKIIGGDTNANILRPRNNARPNYIVSDLRCNAHRARFSLMELRKTVVKKSLYRNQNPSFRFVGNWGHNNLNWACSGELDYIFPLYFLCLWEIVYLNPFTFQDRSLM
jgi:hypothetical protein